MTDAQHDSSSAAEKVPLGQRLFDSWPLLLVAGIVTMVVFYTAWGLVEVMSLEQAPLP